MPLLLLTFRGGGPTVLHSPPTHARRWHLPGSRCLLRFPGAIRSFDFRSTAGNLWEALLHGPRGLSGPCLVAVCPGVRYVSVALLWASRKLLGGALPSACTAPPALHLVPTAPSSLPGRTGAGSSACTVLGLPHRGPSPATRSLAQAHSPIAKFLCRALCAPWTLVRWDTTGTAAERRGRDAGDVSVPRASQQPLALGAASAWLCTVRFRDEPTETLGGWICPSSHSHCVAEPGLDPRPRRCVSCGKWGRWTRLGDGGPKCPG